MQTQTKHGCVAKCNCTPTNMNRPRVDERHLAPLGRMHLPTPPTVNGDRYASLSWQCSNPGPAMTMKKYPDQPIRPSGENPKKMSISRTSKFATATRIGGELQTVAPSVHLPQGQSCRGELTQADDVQFKDQRIRDHVESDTLRPMRP